MEFVSTGWYALRSRANPLVQMTGNDALSLAFVATTSKACPACGAAITHYRGHGCHHIAPSGGCPTCHHHFCIVCLERHPCSRRGHGLFCDEHCDCPVRSDSGAQGGGEMRGVLCVSSWCPVLALISRHTSSQTRAHASRAPPLRLQTCPECRPGEPCPLCSNDGRCTACAVPSTADDRTEPFRFLFLLFFLAWDY